MPLDELVAAMVANGARWTPRDDRPRLSLHCVHLELDQPGFQDVEFALLRVMS